MKNSHLVEKLRARVEVVKEIGGAVGFNTKLVNDELAAHLKDIAVSLPGANNTHTTKTHRRARERYLAVILICASDRGRSIIRLLQELKNDALKGQSALPTTLAEAIAIINSYSALAPTPQLTDGYKGVAFAQKEEGSALNKKMRE